MDQDLLANSMGGVSLPVGELETYRFCPVRGEELTPLATLAGGEPLVSRLATSSGGVYFCGTNTRAANSSLANNGVVLYVAVQRALANGASGLGNTRQLIAGRIEANLAIDWKQIAGSRDAISTEFPFHGGVYENRQQLLAINRAADQEDHASFLSAEQVDGLFERLDFDLVQSDIDTATSLVREIWRVFLLAVILALLAEALLCVPRATNSRTDKNSFFRERKERDVIVKEMQGAA
jgi:hypothetical protein